MAYGPAPSELNSKFVDDNELDFNRTNNSSNKNNYSSGSKPLNFYESMYHFKKMFPKFDTDVIETILRANNGAVDKTIGFDKYIKIYNLV